MAGEGYGPTRILGKLLRPPVSLFLLYRIPRSLAHLRLVLSRSKCRPKIGGEEGIQRVDFAISLTERYRRLLSVLSPLFFLFVVVPDVGSVIVDRSRRKRAIEVSHLRSQSVVVCHLIPLINGIFPELRLTLGLRSPACFENHSGCLGVLT